MSYKHFPIKKINPVLFLRLFKGNTIMKLTFAILILSSLQVFAQSPTPTPERPRVIIVGSSGNQTPTPTPFITPKPTPRSVVIVTQPTNTPFPSPTPYTFATPLPTPTPRPTPLPNAYKPMTYGQIKAKINQAKLLMQSRPTQTAMASGFLVTDIVRVAFNDWKTNDIDFVTMTKSVFLAKDYEYQTTSANGKNVVVRIIRANGVNTPVIVMDMDNKPHTPLIVQYPIERNGSLAEMAYYTSTHPGIGTNEVINAGKIYVRNAIDTAREALQQKGIFIQPIVADMAEKLCAVEHVDHARFRNEYQLNVYNDIFTLFALNEGNTYRYSVSSAGAGGMVQMIPSTYYMVRSRYYSVGLMPDFVEGMRNHANAAQVMLLYMQMTWDDLISSTTISNAIETGIATPAELMSAGYNSNPSKLAGYIRRGGSNWRNLIPRETQIYLQINASLHRFINYVPRAK
jgi:hypothetical protein